MPHDSEERGSHSSQRIRALNLPGTLAAIGQIWIVESLPDGQSKSGRHLWNELDDHCSAHPINLRIGYLEAPTSDVLLGYLDDLRLDVQASGHNPILYIECHGSDDATGLILADGSFLSWDELKPRLEGINIASKFNTVLVLGCCYGGYFGQTTRLQERVAFCAYLAPNRSVSAGMLFDGLKCFYRGLLLERDMTAAINSMVAGAPNMPYFFATAEGLFHLGFAAYIRDLATGEPLVERAQALVQLMRETGTDPLPTTDDVARATKNLEWPEFERLRRLYFCLDLFPENEGRFRLAYGDAARAATGSSPFG